MMDESFADRKTIEHPEVENEKLIGMDLLLGCEAAALNVFRWIGRGDKIAGDAAATDAFRGMLNLMDMCGECAIGEGIKDEAPGIFVGEKLGSWRPGSPAVTIAIDPIDGTTLTAKGLPGAISVIAAARGSSPQDLALQKIPSYYCDKIAVGQKVRESAGHIHIEAPVEQNLEIVALALNKRVRDLVVCLLDRPRHAQLIAHVRKTGAAIRLIGDGDVAGAIAPCLRGSNVDLYMGKGGSPEAVLAAAAIRCLGGELLAKVWPRDEEERASLEADGHADMFDKTYRSADMARGDDIVFAATGITDSDMLRGIRVDGQVAMTHSVVMRAHSRTVRYIKAFHDLARKTIRLASGDGHTHL